MKRRTFLESLGLGATTAALSAPFQSAADPTEHRPPLDADLAVDVLVYGGTSAGVIAAYTAKLYGHDVLLVEPGRHLGGMTSGGLGQTDFRGKGAITGLSRDFYRRVGAYYGEEELGMQFAPSAAEDVFEFYVDTAGVETLFSHQVTDVQKKGTEIQTITLEYAGDSRDGFDLVVGADVFIDTSYEGDLMARAGASYVTGREGNEKYNETLNGVQPSRLHGSYGEAVLTPEFPHGVDGYVVPGDPSSGQLPEIQGVGLAPIGTSDDKEQGYCFRMCLRQDEDRIPIPEPANYNPYRYELLVRTMEIDPPEDLQDLFNIAKLPNGKTDWNNDGAYGFSTDYYGGSWGYPEADYEEREVYWQEHREYQQGLVYFLTHNEQVPGHIREKMQSWGYCPDEFLATGGWPHELYVRGARRMVGEYVMTEHDIVGEEVEDGIALGSYQMDSHTVQRVVVEGPEGPEVQNEGNFYIGGFDPYSISYRSITPKRKEVTNLLVPAALSASHVAHGSIRMEPVFMMLGQSAGVAAAMAQGGDVQAVDVEALQKELYENPMADGSDPPSDTYRLDL